MRRGRREPARPSRLLHRGAPGAPADAFVVPALKDARISPTRARGSSLKSTPAGLRGRRGLPEVWGGRSRAAPCGPRGPGGRPRPPRLQPRPGRGAGRGRLVGAVETQRDEVTPRRGRRERLKEAENETGEGLWDGNPSPFAGGGAGRQRLRREQSRGRETERTVVCPGGRRQEEAQNQPCLGKIGKFA